jgi:hypothetical protein
MCAVQAVSLTPQAQKIFRTTSKSENHMQISDGKQKKLKMHAVSMTPHAQCMRCHRRNFNFEKNTVIKGPIRKIQKPVAVLS